MTSTAEAVTFWILGSIAVLMSLGLLFARKAVYAAMGVAVTMTILGIFYVAQGAPFLGVVQVFVYSGAVMMLFLFVVMLVGVDSSDSLIETIKGQRWIGLLLSLGLAMLLAGMIGKVTIDGTPTLDAVNQGGHISAMANVIFGKYVWVFEITSALLITAALGAMVLAHRERLGAKPNQKAWSQERFRRGEYVSGLPAPGVYARHNAVDTPALLPDGTPSELSVSRTLQARDQVALPGQYTAAEQQLQKEIEEGRTR
ncbi:NADH dehydrogenase subunit J [Nostocoides australiense Ben110]|uniref:NADH-quinone oxidoreductase subunit J n=1 Tax=Nostocoides australiense Ben110 TaxID=1193182 RepID=W6K361_9MICO|nr:NADH-quinone oxidoreductase subunit J [Tetrasphaera australiensis]MCA0290599.1 NADH-quinone oxidoreductase subunit J [Actinomycetota bacterium]CCH75665.1 NADH dehydrogenase subunit J [Tetrasphaera australiensis Ben110]